MQKVRLIFASNQRIGGETKLRVSLKNDWIYEVEKDPSFTIGYTLRKFKIANTPEEEKEKSKMYRAYRIREDPKTRYRYVTEILNMEEARSLVNRKWAQILICQQSLIKNPQEDFKNILDEAERKMLKMIDEEDLRREQGGEKSGEDENHKSSSSSSSDKSDAKAPRRNMGQRRMTAPACNIDEKILNRFRQKFPEL